jgi:hypothetical protein
MTLITELQLALNGNLATTAYQQAMFQQGQPRPCSSPTTCRPITSGRKRAALSSPCRHGRDRLQDRHAERYVRQSNSGHADEATVRSERGRMFWLWWNTLSGSYLVFMSTRRS